MGHRLLGSLPQVSRGHSAWVKWSGWWPVFHFKGSPQSASHSSYHNGDAKGWQRRPAIIFSRFSQRYYAVWLPCSERYHHVCKHRVCSSGSQALPGKTPKCLTHTAILTSMATWSPTKETFTLSELGVEYALVKLWLKLSCSCLFRGYFTSLVLSLRIVIHPN